MVEIMDKNVLAVFIGSLSAMIICSFVIHHALTSLHEASCTIEIKSDKTTTVHIGHYDE